MKICLHTNWEINNKYIGGTERFLINLSKELELLGFESFIVCSSKTEETSVEGVKVLGRCGRKYEDAFYKYPYFSSKFLKNEIIGETYGVDSLKRLSEYTESQLDGIEADIFHLNSFISASYLYSKNNVVITNHENDVEYDWYWGEGFFNFYKDLVFHKKTNLHKFKHLYTPSTFYAEFFSKAFDITVRSIHLGVPLSVFKYDRRDFSLKNEYSFEDNDTVILLPSRFQPFQKGHDIALKACSILKEKGIPFKIIFTGVKKSSEKYKSDFDNLVFEYGLQKYVKVITFPDMNVAYRNVDIVISPERYCSYGLSISEALSLGIPTILSDIPTYREVASNFKHAIFFKSESEHDLAEKLINTIELRNRSRKDAINFRMQYDLRDCSKKYSEIYLKLSV